MKTYEVSLWPNNQSPILLGYYKANTLKEAKKNACKENDIDFNDENLFVVLDSKDAPMRRWNR